MEPDPDPVVGADRDPAHGLGFVIQIGLDAVAADEAGEHQHRLLKSKPGADAHPGA
jgi:hypothetical protein